MGIYLEKQYKNGTELGKQVSGILDRGELVPDDLTIKVIEARLNEPDLKEGVILDGFPRTEAQAEELDKFLRNQGKKVDIVINLETPKEELIQRVINRRICSNQECKTVYNLRLHPPKKQGICDKCGGELIQRKDDNEEVMNSRIDTYFKQTEPLIQFYKEKGVLYTSEISEKINKMGEDIARELVEKLRK